MTAGTFSGLKPLDANDNAEVKALKDSFDYTSLETLESCIEAYQNDTRHYICQLTAIIRSDAEEGHFRHAHALNEHLLHRLKIRAIAAFEAAAQAYIFSPVLGEKLIRLSMDITNERELYKKFHAGLASHLAEPKKIKIAL